MKTTAYWVTGTLVLVIAGAGMAAAHSAPGKGRGGEHGAAIFEMFDSNGDGRVTQAEMDALRAERFAEADANSDGLLSAEEMAAFAEARRAERDANRRSQRIGRMIDHLDKDEDGMISLEEISAEGPARMFERLDSNEDGAITREEAEAARGAMRERRGKDHAGRGHGDGEHRRGTPWLLRAN